MTDKTKMFPVMADKWDPHLLGPEIKEFPWRFLDEEQAMINHSQNLTRLAERGGLTVTEIYANLHKLQFTDGDPGPVSAGWLSNSSRHYPVEYEINYIRTIAKLGADGWNPVTIKPKLMGFYYVSCIRAAGVLAYAYWNGKHWEPVRGGTTTLGFDLWKGEGPTDTPIEVAR